MLFFVLLALSTRAAGTNIYVQMGAAGARTGATWTDAYTNIPNTSIIRGDTYYIGSGNYLTNGAFFGEGHENTDNPLTYIKKATLADHGTNVGWNDSYANPATLGPLQFFNSGWVVDGVYRAGLTNGYGFAVSYAASGCCLDFGGSGNYTSQSNTVRYCELKGSELRDGTTQDRGVQFFGPGVVNGCTVEYSYIHGQDNCSFLLRNVCNFLVQYCYITRNHYTDLQHSEPVSIEGTCTNFTFRYNFGIDCEGSAFICTPYSGSHPGCAGPSIQNWYIYGNVIAYTAWGVANSGGFGDGIFYLFDTQAHGDMMFCNNTIADINHTWNGAIGCDTGGVSPGCADHLYVQNNLFYNCASTVAPISGNVTDFKWDHQAYFSQPNSDADANAQVATGNPFTDTNADWHLTLPIISGLTLPSPFNTDMDGNTRGAADGVPDRGAYEFFGRFDRLTVGSGKARVALTNGNNTLTFY